LPGSLSCARRFSRTCAGRLLWHLHDVPIHRHSRSRPGSPRQAGAGIHRDARV